MTTGDRIRLSRIKLRMTQEELAERVGVQKSAVAKYENGRVTNLKRDMIHKLARVLDVSPSWLMGFSESDVSVEFGEASVEMTEDLAVRELIGIYSELSDNGKQLLLAQARFFRSLEDPSKKVPESVG